VAPTPSVQTPEPHAIQAVDPALGAKRPIAHDRHDEDSESVLKRPGAQRLQTEAADALLK